MKELVSYIQLGKAKEYEHSYSDSINKQLEIMTV